MIEAAAVALPPRYRALFLELYPMGGDAVLAHSPERQQTWTLTVAESASLRRLDRLRSLAEHAAALQGAASEVDLGRQVDRGLLISEAESLQSLGVAQRQPRAARPREPAGEIQRAAFVTRDRPASLARALASAVESATRFGHRLELLVVDDSRDRASAQATQAALPRALPVGISLRYLGPADRLSLVERLAGDAEVDPTLVRFALLGDQRCALGTGAARNCALLAFAGERFLLCDDDVLWRTARPPARPPAELALSAELDPTRFWFFPSGEALAAAVPLDAEDLIAAHGQWLGRDLGGLLQSHSDIDGERVDALFHEQLRRIPSRVRLTMAGTAGDSGLGEPDYLGFDPESMARVSVDEAFHHQVWASRQILRASVGPCVTRPGALVGMQAGIDGTTLLPPFCPVQRSSDGNFARSLRLSDAGALQVHLGLAVSHQPPEWRRSTPEAWRQSRMQLRFPDLLANVLEAFTGRGPGLGALDRLANHVSAAASDQVTGFAAELRRVSWARESRQAQSLDRRLIGAPDFIKRRIGEAQALRLHAASQPHFVVPRDLQTGGDDSAADEALALARELMVGFGQLLHAWPRFWQASVRLRVEEGRA